jgi:hypothetical protein
MPTAGIGLALPDRRATSGTAAAGAALPSEPIIRLCAIELRWVRRVCSDK